MSAVATDPLPLARELIRADSVTPAGPAAFEALERALRDAGFAVERLVFGEPYGKPVPNLFATRGSGRHLAFAGHVDVVPPGLAADWAHHPFAAVVDGDTLHGRGAQDMKGGVAAMVAAATDWAASGGAGRLSFLITGDEEGEAEHGTKALMAWCADRVRFDACVLGEPTSRRQLGDTVKVGRRGSLSGSVTVRGRQGHVAYPEMAENPIPALLAIAQALRLPIDRGSERFAPSNLEIVSIDVGNAAWNVIPERASLRFNVRFNDTWTLANLKQTLAICVRDAAPEAAVDIDWKDGASEAFVTDDVALIDTVAAAVNRVTGLTPEATTTGGTSDARFIRDHCPVLEFGAVGDTMHQVDERTSVEELRRLAAVYREIIAAVIE